MEDLQGYVEHIVFRNADNGYTVLNLISEEDEITCVGIFPVVTEGEILLLHGEYTSHPTYGEQFQMKSYETKAPEDVLSMERYLASGAIKGIGVALASRIVRRFKKDTFRIMDPTEQLCAIGKEVHALVEKQYNTYNRSLMPILRKEGIRIIGAYEELNEKQATYVDK